MKIPKGKCISIYPYSSVIIMENLDIYESFIDPDDFDMQLRKLPFKADINFEEYYGIEGKANWFNPHLPVIIENNKLIWDY